MLRAPSGALSLKPAGKCRYRDTIQARRMPG
jgi:hypothetical protein